MSNRARRTLVITPALLRRMALPLPDKGGDKEERGRVLVVGGEAETPGALVLAATAALRAGAGKLRIAAPKGVAQALAAAVPEARVFGLPETKAGALAPSAAREIAELSAGVQAVLVGPGMIDEGSISRLMKEVLPRAGRAALILDAGALACIRDSPDLLRGLGRRVILTPNHDEMASIRGSSEAEIKRDPAGLAKGAADDWGAVVALKGRETFIASPAVREVYSNRAGNVGLATSGSGDVLCGIIAGLAARGSAPLQSAVWGVYVHARAGEALAKKVGPLGYLARELAAEVPALMSMLGK